MDKFSDIYKRAALRKGDKHTLESCLPVVKSSQDIAAITDDRFLSEMSRCVFQAGFVWRVVNQKWDGFEKAFLGFNPAKLVLLSPEQLEEIGRDSSIVRNMQKIVSVQKNAQLILDLSRQYGNFAGMIQQWPSDNLTGLFKLLKQKGSRLGGATGPRALRNLGIDTFLLTKDVVLCLQQAGVQISDNPSSQKDLTLVQTAFNTWHRETNLPYSHLSRICACSIGDNYPVEQLRH